MAFVEVELDASELEDAPQSPVTVTVTVKGSPVVVDLSDVTYDTTLEADTSEATLAMET